MRTEGRIWVLKLWVCARVGVCEMGPEELGESQSQNVGRPEIQKPQITLFSVFPPWTKKMNPEDPATLDACSGSVETPGNSGPRKRPTSTSSSPEPPEFSTFRACQ